MPFFKSVLQDQVVIVERFGKFDRVARGGCLFLPIPGMFSIAGKLSRRVLQLKSTIETKTQDNVFAQLQVVLSYCLNDNDKSCVSAFYKLDNPQAQISSFIEDIVRSIVTELPVDELFSNKDSIAKRVEERLVQDLHEFGYNVLSALVVDIQIDSEVRTAMTDIEVARRNRFRDAEFAQIERLVQVKRAQTQALATELAGKGLARQRNAIWEGLEQSVQNLSGTVEIDYSEALAMLLTDDYLDAMRTMVGKGTAKLVAYPKRTFQTKSGFRRLESRLRHLERSEFEI